MIRLAMSALFHLRPTAFVIALFAAQSLTAQEDLRTWTNLEGRTVRAALIDVNATHVLLKLENGTQSAILINTLSAADQTFLKSAKPAPTPVPAASSAASGLAWPGVINIKPKELDITVGLQDSAARRYHYTSGSFEFISTAPLTNAVVREVAADFELVRESIRQLPWNWVPQPKEGPFFRIFMAETFEDYVTLGGGDNRGAIKDGNGITRFDSIGLKKVGQRYAFDRREKSDGEIVTLVAQLLTDDMRGYMLPWSYNGLTHILRDVAYQNGKISFQGLESSMKRMLKDRERYKFEADRLMAYLQSDWNQRSSDADLIRHREITDGMLLFYYFGYMDGDGTGAGLHAYFKDVAKAGHAYVTRDPNRSRDSAAVQRKTYLDRMLAGRSMDQIKADIVAKYRALGIKFE